MSVQVAEPAPENPWLDEVLADVEDGICVVGADGRIAAANPSFIRHLALPPPMAEPGRPFADLARHLIERGDLGPEHVAQLMVGRLPRGGARPTVHEVDVGDRRCAIQSRPLPDGGLVQLCRHLPGVATSTTAHARHAGHGSDAGFGLQQAGEAIAEGLALFDADGALTFCNGAYRELHPEIAERLVPGVAFEAVMRLAVESGQLALDAGAADELTRAHIHLAVGAEAHHEVRRGDGRWLRISDRRTSDGGIVSLRSDITAIKRLEATAAELSHELKRQQQRFAQSAQDEEALRAYADKLERSNRELQDFASIASHDLQEPLRKIEAFGQRLHAKYGEELGDAGKMYIDRMQNAAGRMRVLIDDLLTYSRVSTKAKPFEAIDLATIVDEVLSDLQVTLEQAEGRVEVASLPTIDADPTQMRQLIQNLLTNALKFRRQGVPPVVRIEGRPVPTAQPDATEQCEIRMIDNGIGFEAKYADRIFGIFQRLHGRNEYEGTGIGLATCRKIVERHGGTIVATSTPGEGATFTFTLPVRQPAGDSEP